MTLCSFESFFLACAASNLVRFGGFFGEFSFCLAMSYLEFVDDSSRLAERAKLCLGGIGLESRVKMAAISANITHLDRNNHLPISSLRKTLLVDWWHGTAFASNPDNDDAKRHHRKLSNHK